MSLKMLRQDHANHAMWGGYAAAAGVLIGSALRGAIAARTGLMLSDRWHAAIACITAAAAREAYGVWRDRTLRAWDWADFGATLLGGVPVVAVVDG